MSLHPVPEAWVDLPSQEELEALVPPGSPYNFGFIPAMARLMMAHPRLGMAFSALFRHVMFEPGKLTRNEREMIASVAASAQECFY